MFTTSPCRGDPVAVVPDGTDLADEEMQGLARWTNLSETTFVLPPTTPEADYRLRIFSPQGELPFAGHPTLRSARAWLDGGGTPQHADRIVQECAAGLVIVRRGEGTLAFAAPPLVREGALDGAYLNQTCPLSRTGWSARSVLTPTGPSTTSRCAPSPRAAVWPRTRCAAA
ncbi:PhzF family phenazine biosynthesis protein [Streptomyces sp. NPDC054834]